MSAVYFRWALSACLLVAALGVSASGWALSLDYAHEYADRSEKHKDIFAFSHSFFGAVGIKAKYKFVPREKPNGDTGNAFDDDKLNEREYTLKYGWKFAPRWKLVPEIKYAIKDKEKKYKPELKAQYKLFKGTKVGVGYVFYVKDKRGKSVTRTHEIKASASQQMGRWTLGYEYTHYNGNHALFNNGHSDYKHDVELAYRINPHWAPFIEFKNVSVADDSSKRETESYLGLSYTL
ncbi:oligogalacturonate-specific porin KdgM family protein [Carnimonas bestiolae]|uniref:oligogalacturonate-specific porin KdgM family protein n=1 Tax=Carnimonas bestiolae TaxID=3402172 RepID=UPI003EDC5E5E